MLKKIILYAISFIVLAGLLSACAPTGSPSEAIEAYFETLASKDEIQAVNLSCASWEEGARTDVSGLVGVGVALDNVTCQVEDEAGMEATVSCTGNLVFTYAGSEDIFRDLSGDLYQATLEDGEWKMCGYR